MLSSLSPLHLGFILMFQMFGWLRLLVIYWSALGTDFAIEVITEESAFLSGTASSGTSRTLIDNTKSMLVDRFCNYSIKSNKWTRNRWRK
jgi:hypothetical protein